MVGASTSSSAPTTHPSDAHSPPSYHFPRSHLKNPEHPEKQPLILVSCGSFSPPTLLHTRMFALASSYLDSTPSLASRFELIGGYLSPVSDQYQKLGLVEACHRVKMCAMAVKGSGLEWVGVDPWEAERGMYTPTAEVLRHFDACINDHGDPEGGKKVRVVLLAGADLLETMREPDVWSVADLDNIVGTYGVFVVPRKGTDVKQVLEGLEKVEGWKSSWKENIWVVDQVVDNDVSSTKVRRRRMSGLSVRGLVHDAVRRYINDQGLYESDESSSGSESSSAKEC